MHLSQATSHAVKEHPDGCSSDQPFAALLLRPKPSPAHRLPRINIDCAGHSTSHGSAGARSQEHTVDPDTDLQDMT